MVATLDNLKATLRISFKLIGSKSLDMSIPKDRLSMVYENEYTFGDGVLECNAVWHDTRTLAAGAGGFETLDLAGAALINAFGDPVVFANIKLMIIQNPDTNNSSCDLWIGGAPAQPFSDWLGDPTDIAIVHPGETKPLICRIDGDGYLCTGGARDQLLIANNSGTHPVTYSIILMGDSA